MLLRPKAPLAVVLVVTGLTTAHAGMFDIFKDGKFKLDVGKSIDKSVQDVSKSLGHIGKDIGKTVPETEHSPPDPCANNTKLPQCELDKAGPS